MALKDITITGSIGSIPTQSYDQKTYISSTDEQSFPLETIIGGAGGSTPDLYGNVSSSNLIVNITQSWSGSINTPVGIVAFVDQTQNEFINGQYSGSDILVTDGELSADNPFLEFSTTIDYYTPILYYDLGPLSTSPALSYINVPLNNFLDQATEPDNGEIYLLASITYSGIFSLGTNVTCAKISRYDSTGNDRSNVLQQLTDFRIKYSNNNILQYDIINLVNYGTYYLYYLTPKPLGNIASGDFKYLDYTVSASNSSTISIGVDALVTASFSTITTNPLGYLSSSGVYTLDNTPNLRLYFTASFTSSNRGSVLLTTYPSLLSTGNSYSYNTSGNYTFTGSFTPIENEQYILLFVGGPINSHNVTNLEFNITQSTISPQSGVLDTIIFSPDFEIDFFYNDWNVLYGNADGLELDNTFMKVNYETGQTIPTNQQQILTGSAERAPVKPYNYALRAQILPRYEGVRSYQQNENVWTEGDSGSFGEEPSVQNLQTYFAFFNFVAETDYELIGKSVVNVLYLVDKDGNTITPSLLAPYYPNLIQNFPTTQNVNVQFYTYNGNPNNFTSTYPIIRAGALPVPILYSQTGSTENSSSYIGFDTLNNVPNYGTSIQIYNQIWNIGSFDNILDASGGTPPTVNFTSPGYTSYNGVSPERSIVINASSNKTQVIPSINIYLQFNRINNFTNPFTVNGILKIYKYTNSNWSVIATSNITISQTGQYFSLSSSPQVPVNTDEYRVTLETIGPPTGWGNIVQGGGTFTLTQTTPPSVQQITASYYWETGSSSKNILTGSGFTSNVYNLYQTFPSSSDYLNVLQFNVKQYDEIRFEGDENQTYVIDSVSDPFDSPDGKLYLTLNKDIVNGTNLDSFFIRRFQENPNYIILDTSFNSSNTSGFLFPEYESLDIQNNFNNIIQKLTEKGLI